MESVFLSDPRLLEITGPNGEVYRGANQEWYRLRWRRMAGCGPTAAAVQLSYLSAARPGWEELCPLKARERETFTDYMDEIWEHVTPGPHGLNSVTLYTDGVRSYGAERSFPLAPLSLAVPKALEQRPSWQDCLSFVHAGLEADCPVAFLNLNNGAVNELDSWHWVLITALTLNEGGATALLADAGKQFPIDLKLWYDTTAEGGGFVFLPSGAPL